MLCFLFIIIIILSYYEHLYICICISIYPFVCLFVYLPISQSVILVLCLTPYSIFLYLKNTTTVVCRLKLQNIVTKALHCDKRFSKISPKQRIVPKTTYKYPVIDLNRILNTRQEET